MERFAAMLASKNDGRELTLLRTILGMALRDAARGCLKLLATCDTGGDDAVGILLSAQDIAALT
jgi:hypothetical protein